MMIWEQTEGNLTPGVIDNQNSHVSEKDRLMLCVAYSYCTQNNHDLSYVTYHKYIGFESYQACTGYLQCSLNFL